MTVQTRYDGTFDLGFLRDGETVAAVGDGSGACYVTRRIVFGISQRVRVDVGETLERLTTGALIAYDATSLHEWRCPSCGATTRARMADGGER